MLSTISWLLKDKLFLTVVRISMFLNGTSESHLNIAPIVSAKFELALRLINKIKMMIVTCVIIKYCITIIVLYHDIKLSKQNRQIWSQNNKNITLTRKKDDYINIFHGPYHGKPELEWSSIMRLITIFVLLDGASITNKLNGYSTYVGKCEFVQLIFNPNKYETDAWLGWQDQVSFLKMASEQIFLRQATDCHQVLLAYTRRCYCQQLMLLQRIAKCKSSFYKFEFGITSYELRERGKLKLALYCLLFFSTIIISYIRNLPKRVNEVYHKPVFQLDGMIFYTMIEYIIVSFFLFQAGFFMQSITIAMTDNSELNITRLDFSFKSCSSLITNATTFYRLGMITIPQLNTELQTANEIILKCIIQMRLVEIKMRSVKLMVQAMANYLSWASIVSVTSYFTFYSLNLFPLTIIPIEMPFLLLFVNLALSKAANFNRRCNKLMHKTLITLVADIVDMDETLGNIQESRFKYTNKINTNNTYYSESTDFDSRTIYNPFSLNPITVQLLRDNLVHSEIWIDKLALKLFGIEMKYDMMLKVSYARRNFDCNEFSYVTI